MAPVQISEHAGTFLNSILMLSKELSRKIIACERPNITPPFPKKRIRKCLACGWMELIHVGSLKKYTMFFLLGWMGSSCFNPISFFSFCVYFIKFCVVYRSMIPKMFILISCYFPLHAAFSILSFYSLSFSTSTLFFFLYFWLSWRPFSVLWPLGFKWCPSAACLSS